MAAASLLAKTSNKLSSLTTPNPADSVLVAVKLLHTNDDKNFLGVKMHIDMAPGRPNPLDLRTQFLVAQKLLPWVGDHHGTADTKDVATLETAIKAVDLTALDKADQTAFDASLTKALALLEPLRSILQKDTIHMTGNSHIDAAWLWPESETIDVVRRTFSTALQLMNEYPRLHLHAICRPVQRVDRR